MLCYINCIITLQIPNINIRINGVSMNKKIKWKPSPTESTFCRVSEQGYMLSLVFTKRGKTEDEKDEVKFLVWPPHVKNKEHSLDPYKSHLNAYKSIAVCSNIKEATVAAENHLRENYLEINSKNEEDIESLEEMNSPSSQ